MITGNGVTLWRVFCLALVARVLFLGVFVIDEPARLSGTVAIASNWNEIGRIALNLSEGRGFSSPFDHSAHPTAWVCPAIPTLWAGILIVAGGDSPTAILAAWLSQAIASSLAAVFYVAILRRVLRKRMTDRILAGWALVVVLWPESILRVTELWYYTWQELGVALLVWCGIAWAEEQSLRNAVFLGCAGGLVALVNITPIPLFLIAVCAPLLAPRAASAAWRRAALSVGLVALIVTPWMVRNAVVFGHLIPLRGNGGFELWQGNNPRGSIRQTQDSVHPGIDPRELRAYQELGEYEYNRQALTRATSWIRANPLQFVTNIAARAYVVWCTDITDRWSWDGTKWWQSARVTWLVAVRQLTSTFTALASLAAALIGVCLVGPRSIPYPCLILGAPLLVPLPHYFTQIDPSYVAFIRVWLLMIAFASYAHWRATLNPGSRPPGQSSLGTSP